MKNRANCDTSAKFGTVILMGILSKSAPTGHLKIQDGGHFSRWPPNRPSESVFSHGIVCTCSISMILVSIPMFLGMLNSILLV